jgi:hypothetical protein
VKVNRNPVITLASIAAALIVVALPAVLQAGTVELKTLWDDTRKVVDGKASDWQLGASTLFTEEKAAFSAANDSDYIFLLFRTNDIQTARTIAAAGLTIYLDAEGGKHDDRFYVRFVGGPKIEGLTPMSGHGPAGESSQRGGSEQRQRPEQREPTLFCYVKDKTDETAIPLDGSKGPAVAVDTSAGFYIYEFRVPISDDSADALGVSAELGHKLGIGLKWGDMTAFMPKGAGEGQRPDATGGGPGGMGSGPGGMGGGPGGGPGGGRGGEMGGGGHERPDMPTKKEIWMKTELQVAPTSTTPDVQ